MRVYIRSGGVVDDPRGGIDVTTGGPSQNQRSDMVASTWVRRSCGLRHSGWGRDATRAPYILKSRNFPSPLGWGRTTRVRDGLIDGAPGACE